MSIVTIEAREILFEQIEAALQRVETVRELGKIANDLRNKAGQLEAQAGQLTERVVAPEGFCFQIGTTAHEHVLEVDRRIREHGETKWHHTRLSDSPPGGPTPTGLEPHMTRGYYNDQKTFLADILEYNPANQTYYGYSADEQWRARCEAGTWIKLAEIPEQRTT